MFLISIKISRQNNSSISFFSRFSKKWAAVMEITYQANDPLIITLCQAVNQTFTMVDDLFQEFIHLKQI